MRSGAYPQRAPHLRVIVQAMVAGMAAIIFLAAVWGCSKQAILKVDGSSTVFPITEAMAEEFQRAHGEFRVTVSISGTGGGFKKFCKGEIDIASASRPIKRVEVDACARGAIDYIELPVAFDGLAVIVNPDNDWVDQLDIEELKEIWRPGSTVEKWSDVRPEWPERDIELVGADTDSGTFDYFTKATVGIEGASRSDYTASTDDNVLVTAVVREKFALGYLGFAFYVENTDRLKLVPIDPGTGAVAPSAETIKGGAYVPLSRPLFIYVRSAVADRPEVKEFVRFYLDEENTDLILETGYVGFPENIYKLVQERFHKGITGSVFGGKGSQIGVSIEDLLDREN